jgi:hypothetical protein
MNPSQAGYLEWLTTQRGLTAPHRKMLIDECVSLSEAAETKSNVPKEKPPQFPKAAIPPHLLKTSGGKGMRAKSTQPTGSGGRGKGGPKKSKGWRAITAGDAVDYGFKAWQLAKHLATLINVEDKKFDVDGTAGAVVTTTATIVNLTNIAQGNDYNNRSGDSILGQALEFRARVTGNSAGPMQNLRLLVVVDRENHGVDPVIGDVLQGATSPFLAPMLATAANRFEVLFDEYVVLTNAVGLAATGTSTDYVPDTIILRPLIRKWNKHIKYTSSAGADASNWENAIFLMAISSSASNGPNLAYHFRLHFTDN